MVAEGLLDLFDSQLRPEGIVAGDGYTMVFRPPADGDVEALVAELRARPGYVEWKYYEHDGPELKERLLAAGLEPDDEETVVVAEAASLPPAPPDVDVRIASDDFVELAHRVFGGRRRELEPQSVAVVAYVDGVAASGGRIDFEEDKDFAGLFGGVTLPEFRSRGLYRATVAKRAELARERGYRWLFVDALPTSRPILERLGFVRLTATTPFTPPAAG
ncbi:MAG TPA: GNAT family N-acetyltransferase [Gaiellaceae bacterium]|nr:GNAT family N-acetyltransferase [Gaiellaceae bacterium]